jgi:membrane-associated protein
LSAFLPTLLALLQEFGYLALWLSAFVSAFGFPIPTILLLLAAGAFAALGDFNIVILALVAFTASVCGDNLGYFVGKRFGRRFLNWLAHRRRFRLITPQRLEQAQHYFNRHGSWAIFLSRFFIIALGGIINLLAGAEEYHYPRFLLYDVLGELLGAIIPLLLGYLFSASWEMIGNIIGLISLLALSLFIAIFLLIRLAILLRQSAKQQIRQEKQTHTKEVSPSPQASLKTSTDESPL